MRTFRFVIAAAFILVSCISRPPIETEVPPERVTADGPALEEPSTSPPPTEIATMVVEPTEKPPAETVTSLPPVIKSTESASESTEEPIEGATTNPITAAIEYFEAAPAILSAGDITELKWDASGVSAEICPISRYEYFTLDDCQQVALSGSLHFQIPDDLRPSFAPGFRLKVEGAAGSENQQTYAYVYLTCPTDWFFNSEPAAGPNCPQESLSSWTAIQNFEYGTMIWIESLGRYYIFSPQPLDQSPLNQHQQFSQVDDPLSITGDTPSEYTPPEGLFAPDSGFGFVWRGDVADGQPLLEVLGWASAPEYGYQASFQCTEFHSTQFGTACYLEGPQGVLIWLDTHYQRWQRLR